MIPYIYAELYRGPGKQLQSMASHPIGKFLPGSIELPIRRGQCRRIGLEHLFITAESENKYRF
jgi:hypothetical protein